MSSLGLPGLNNFVGEILILIGTFKAHPVTAVLGFAGLVFGVVYILNMIQKTIFGQYKKDASVLWDLDAREIFILTILALGVLFMGLRPGVILALFDAPIKDLMAVVTP